MASCAMPAAPGMNIKTDTPLVKKAREGVMEFLLVSSCGLSLHSHHLVWQQPNKLAAMTCVTFCSEWGCSK